MLNPTSSILAFIEPFVDAEIKCVSWILFFLLLLLKISCRRTPETDSPNPWGSIEPRLRTTALEYASAHAWCELSAVAYNFAFQHWMVFSKLTVYVNDFLKSTLFSRFSFICILATIDSFGCVAILCSAISFMNYWYWEWDTNRCLQSSINISITGSTFKKSQAHSSPFF